MMRRAVVTGVGAVTPLGVGVQSTWSNLLNGASGLGTICFNEENWEDKIPSRVAAMIDPVALAKGLEQVVTNKRAQSKFIGLAMLAAEEALQDSGLKDMIKNEEIEASRCGVAIGSGIGGSVEEVMEATRLVETDGLRKLSPYFVPRLLINLAAGHVSIKYNLQGPNHSCVTACASGAHSIGDAARFVMLGDADVMVAGGTEASINPLSFAGFSRLKALSTKYNDHPNLASRPFDKDRDGFVMGEGAGVMVIEEYEHAKKRGATIYGEITGYGLSGDAFHLTAPSEDGKGARAAMKSAMRNLSSIDDLDYINCHATSTPLGDAVELEAIAKIVGKTTDKVSVSSTKGAVGHLLGAAGSVEAIFALLSVKNDVVPPTLNLFETDIDGDVISSMDLVAHHSKERVVKNALSNSFGFGGTNASLLFSKV